MSLNGVHFAKTLSGDDWEETGFSSVPSPEEDTLTTALTQRFQCTEVLNISPCSPPTHKVITSGEASAYRRQIPPDLNLEISPSTVGKTEGEGVSGFHN